MRLIWSLIILMVLLLGYLWNPYWQPWLAGDRYTPQWLATVQAGQRLAAAEAVDVATAAVVGAPPPFEHYDAIDARPLLTDNRQRIMRDRAVVVNSVPLAPPGEFFLTAIIATSAHHYMAYLKQGKRHVALQLGDQFLDWQVTALDAVSLTLTRDEAQQILWLRPYLHRD
ncbi:MAG: hypothetical protein HQL49_03900 [Gammaproteobacteria bacterium]|nr:hypothetical protein [Gammaproteobacteria bacterium]